MPDIGAAFKFQFRDPNWVSKLLLGALFSLLGVFLIGAFLVMGYQVEVIQRVIRKEPNPLPEWDRLSEKLLRGVKLFVVSIAYFLPLFVIVFPIILFLVFGVASDSEAIAAFSGMGLAAAILFIVLPYSLFVAVLLPVIYLKFALRERIGDALNVASILRFFGQNWQNIILLALIMLGVNLLAALGVLFCIVGIFFTSFCAKLVSAHLTGQLYLASADAQTLST
jgi:hypothetical protein